MMKLCFRSFFSEDFVPRGCDTMTYGSSTRRQKSGVSRMQVLTILIVNKWWNLLNKLKTFSLLYDVLHYFAVINWQSCSYWCRHHRVQIWRWSRFQTSVAKCSYAEVIYQFSLEFYDSTFTFSSSLPVDVTIILALITNAAIQLQG